MGGNNVLVDCIMEKGAMEMQALRVIHTAAANNVKFQLKILEREAGIVPWLLEVRATPLLHRHSFWANPVRVSVRLLWMG